MSNTAGNDGSGRQGTVAPRSVHIAIAILGSMLCLYAATTVRSEDAPNASASGYGLNEDTRMTRERPSLQVPLTDSEPDVDGKLDEPCWKDAAKTGPLTATPRRSTNSTTEAFILRDVDHLYVGVRCAGKDLVKRKVTPGKPAANTEFVQLSIDSNADRNSYYLIRINSANGVVASSYNEHTPPWGDRTWQPPFSSAVARGADGWSAEFALPFNIFLKNKTLASDIGFNICRAGMPGGETHCWQGTSTNPAAWGTLTGIPSRENLPRPDYSTRGLNRFYRPPSRANWSFLAEEAERTISLGPGSAHAGTTGEVRLELDGFLLAGDPHARGIIWDMAVDEQKGELYVLADTRPARGVAELRVFDRQGEYLRTIMPLNPTLPRSSVWDLCRKTAREDGTELIIPSGGQLFALDTLAVRLFRRRARVRSAFAFSSKRWTTR